MQPGETITPNSDKKPEADKQAPAEAENKHDEKPKVHTSNQANEQPAEPASPWQFTQENDPQAAFERPQIETLTWSASEFLDHEKNAGWFLAFAGVAAAAVVLIYFITGDLVTVVVVALAAVLFAVTAKRRPRTLEYKLDEGGIHIAEKTFPYEIFKSFSVLEEGAFDSIQLMPLKRFMPPISLYFPPENEVQIVNTLGSYLPHEERTHDAIERLMRRVRF